jgi:CTP:molybdopterin cytidylyltransferase MocA
MAGGDIRRYCPASLIPAILACGKNGRLKAVLKQHENIALEVAVDDSFILEDIDTTEDYKNLLKLYRD